MIGRTISYPTCLAAGGSHPEAQLPDHLSPQPMSGPPSHHPVTHQLLDPLALDSSPRTTLAPYFISCSQSGWAGCFRAGLETATKREEEVSDS